MHLLLDYYVDGFDGGLNYLQYLSPSVSLDFDVNINNVTLSVRIKGKNFVQSKS